MLAIFYVLFFLFVLGGLLIFGSRIVFAFRDKESGGCMKTFVIVLAAMAILFILWELARLL